MSTGISLSKLEAGFGIGVNHIQEMLDSSKILFDTKHYTMSIVTSVLVLEEITKIAEISEHIRSKKSISKKEWNKLSGSWSHSTKLTKLVEDAQNKVIEMGEEHHQRVEELNKKLGESGHLDFQTLSGKKI